MTNTTLIPVILCGGTGSRLWPLSRASYPKQYLALGSDSEESLLQQTQRRLKGLQSLSDPLLICHEDHRFIVAEQMRQIDADPSAILLEPVGRNTAPAIAVAALKATERGEDPLLLVLAADHLISEKKELLRVIEAGRIPAEAGRLVTFGIVPTAPETGYGYIESEKPLDIKSATGALPIARFIEKPDRATAEKFLLENGYTAATYERYIKNIELKGQLLKYYSGGIKLPEFIIDELFIKENQIKNLEYINLNEIYKNKIIDENEIKKTYEENKVILVPHTAVGVGAAKKLSFNDCIVLSTAHPCKFPDATINAINKHEELPEELQQVLNKDENFKVLNNDTEEVKSFVKSKV